MLMHVGGGDVILRSPGPPVVVAHNRSDYGCNVELDSGLRILWY